MAHRQIRVTLPAKALQFAASAKDLTPELRKECEKRGYEWLDTESCEMMPMSGDWRFECLVRPLITDPSWMLL